MTFEIPIDEVKLEAFYMILARGLPPIRDWTELTDIEMQELWNMYIQIKIL
jgi:hypothetical protein